MMLKSRFHTSC